MQKPTFMKKIDKKNNDVNLIYLLIYPARLCSRDKLDEEVDCNLPWVRDTAVCKGQRAACLSDHSKQLGKDFGFDRNCQFVP